MDNSREAPDASEKDGASHFDVRISASELTRLLGTSAWRPLPPTLGADILLLGETALMVTRGADFERCSPILDAALSADDTQMVISLIPIKGRSNIIVLHRAS